MAENMLSNRPDYGRTFNTAMWMVGLVASIQLFAVVWAVFSRSVPRHLNAGGSMPEVAAGGSLGIFAPPISEGSVHTMGGQAAVAPIVKPHPLNSARDIQIAEADLLSAPGDDQGDKRLGEFDSTFQEMAASGAPVLPEPSFYGPEDAGPSLSESLTEAAFTSARIEDSILERLVSTGEELRAAGNMPSALQALREAEAALPEHPRILGGMAATFSQMGLDAKAESYWEQLLALGPVRGGAYYDLAKRQLQGEREVPAASDRQVMSIGEIKVDEQSPGAEGQRVSLRIVIDADVALRPNGADLSLLVYFYDQVDGKRVETSTADTSYLYPTEPYDWQINGTEEILVIYNQPIFSEEQARELGERKYYGYAIELYYHDRLQDRVLMPEDIADVRMNEVEYDLEAPSGPIGPENALFPDAPQF
tara:strand:+ start:1279 stop:2541 length:1263 start_codon:yes stop_codon:yes gene_type:complete